MTKFDPKEVGGLVKRLRAAEASERIYGSDHTADLIAEAYDAIEALAGELAAARSDALSVGDQMLAEKFRADNLSGELTTERAAHAETKWERDEALKALEPFAEIAGEVWADENGWTEASCQNDRICDWFGPSAFRAARRVREGGKEGG